MADSEISPERPAGSSQTSPPTVISLNPGQLPCEPSEAPPPDPVSEPVWVRPDQQPTVISVRPQSAAVHPPTGASPLELGSDMEGRKLGHFRLEQFVGGGGMGAVYRGRDLKLDRTVAVKVLSPDRAADEETIRRFENEAQSAARLDHENIARVFYVGDEEGLRYIVFEFIDGINVRDLVERDGPLPVENAISYVLQVAEALAHAARRDVVHRDIKPSNVLITPDGRAKLVDMGLARLERVRPDGDELTATGVTLGTFDYISPEQARDPRSADVRSDLYSLGCTIYFMLTGRPPFPEGTVLQKLLSHSSDEPTDPRILRPDLPEDVARIVLRMLAKNPDQRYQDPSALVGELLLTAENLGLHPASHGGTIWISPTSAEPSAIERHLPWVAPMVVLLVVVLSLNWFWPLPDDESAQLPGGFLEQSETAPAQSPEQLPPEGTDSSHETGVDDRDRSVPVPSELSDRLHTSREDTSREETEIVPRWATSGVDPETAGAGAIASGPGNNSNDAEAAEQDASQSGLFMGESSPTGDSPPWIQDEVSYAPFEPRAVAERPSESAEQGFGTPLREDAAAPAAGPQDILIVGQYDGFLARDQSRYFGSLGAACEKARSTPDIRVIELRYDGRLEQAEEPFTLANPNLVIRAGDGFTPVVRFQPTRAALELGPTGMMRIVGGTLRLEGIQWELDVPVEPEVTCELFELVHVEELKLDRCVVTVRAPTRSRRYDLFDQPIVHMERVAVFDLKDPMVGGTLVDMESGALSRWSVVDLRDSVVRGDATMARALEAVPFRLNWRNGFLATSERMLTIGGTRLIPNRINEHIRVKLDHVTAVMARGLCQIDSEDTRSVDMVTVDVNCLQCILMLTLPVPLFEQVGWVEHDPLELSSMLLFAGERNFYENVELYWNMKSKIRSLADDLAQPPDDYATLQMDADDWRDQWNETLPKSNKVRWRTLPLPNGLCCEQSPRDYLLDDQLGNPAIDSGPGANGGDAGFDIDQLPEPLSTDGDRPFPSL